MAAKAGKNQERVSKYTMRNEWDATWLSNATASFASAAGQIVLFAYGVSLSTGRVVSGAGMEVMMNDTAPSLPARPVATCPGFRATRAARPLRSRLRASTRERMVAI